MLSQPESMIIVQIEASQSFHKRLQFPDPDFRYYSTLLQDVSYFCSRSSFEEYFRCKAFVKFDYGILTLDQVRDHDDPCSVQRLESYIFRSEKSSSEVEVL